MSRRESLAETILAVIGGWLGRPRATGIREAAMAVGPHRHLIAGAAICLGTIAVIAPIGPLAPLLAAWAGFLSILAGLSYLFFPQAGTFGEIFPRSFNRTLLRVGAARVSGSALVGLAMILGTAIALVWIVTSNCGTQPTSTPAAPPATHISSPTPPPSPPTPTATFEPGSQGDCWFTAPEAYTKVQHRVIPAIACAPGTSVEGVVVLVDPPQFQGEARLSPGVHPLKELDGTAYYAEVWIGTESTIDDGWAYNVCIKRLTADAFKTVEDYWLSPSRVGLGEDPEELETMDCLPLTHDPNAPPITPSKVPLGATGKFSGP